MSIQVYNTLTRQKEPFVPLEDHKVKMYVCGPTVYNFFHIGNARPFVVFDQVRRYLQYRGFDVRYVMNFTDVDDKIIKRSLVEGISAQEVADKYVEAFFTDVEALHVQRADVYPRVTEEMQEIIAMIEELISSGHAYESQGDVYFSAQSFDEYGKLSKQTLENLVAGARVEVSDKKQNQVDFALWKAAKPDEVAWTSPWGEGRPGWHIECSAMIRKHLGDQIDIHGGGVDLTFPHHENEIAQSEACSHKQLAKYWMHNEFVNLNNEKMSKSTGNFLTTRDLLEQYEGAVLRFLLLSAHYRNPVNFSPELADNAKNGLERIRSSYANLKHRLETAVGGDAEKVELDAFRTQFIDAMDEDFNTADAITAIFELVSDANKYLRQELVQRQTLEAYVSLFEELMGVLAVPLSDLDEPDAFDLEVAQLIADRDQARKDKDWARADEIRDQFNAMGIVLEDTPHGIRWRRK